MSKMLNDTVKIDLIISATENLSCPLIKPTANSHVLRFLCDML